MKNLLLADEFRLCSVAIRHVAYIVVVPAKVFLVCLFIAIIARIKQGEREREG